MTANIHLKQAISFILAAAMLLAVLTSCGDGKSQAGENAEFTDFPLSATNLIGLNREFSADDYPVTGSTKYTLQFDQTLFENLLYSEDGQDVTSHINYPRESYTADKLESKLKKGDIDIAFIEMTKGERPFDDELEYTLIGVLPVVLVTSYQNSVSSISSDMLDKMLLKGKVTDWSDLGGESGEIHYISNIGGGPNGYEALARVLYGKEKKLKPDFQDLYDVADYPKELGIPLMSLAGAYGDGGYCLGVYNPYYLLAIMFDSDGADAVKPVYIDGIKPTHDSVASGEYPYTLYTYAVTRKDESNANVGYMLDWLTKNDFYTDRTKGSIGYVSIFPRLSPVINKDEAKSVIERCIADNPQYYKDDDLERVIANDREWMSLVQ